MELPRHHRQDLQRSHQLIEPMKASRVYSGRHHNTSLQICRWPASGGGHQLRPPDLQVVVQVPVAAVAEALAQDPLPPPVSDCNSRCSLACFQTVGTASSVVHQCGSRSLVRELFVSERHCNSAVGTSNSTQLESLGLRLGSCNGKSH